MTYVVQALLAYGLGVVVGRWGLTGPRVRNRHPRYPVSPMRMRQLDIIDPAATVRDRRTIIRIIPKGHDQ